MPAASSAVSEVSLPVVVEVSAAPLLSTFILPVDGVESSDVVDDESADESCDSVEDSADDVDVESPVEPDVDAFDDEPEVDDFDDEPEVDDFDDEPEVDDSDDELDVESGSAHATPGVVAIAIPTPNATANPPTRPMYLALPMVIPSDTSAGDPDMPGSCPHDPISLLSEARRSRKFLI